MAKAGSGPGVMLAPGFCVGDGSAPRAGGPEVASRAPAERFAHSSTAKPACLALGRSLWTPFRFVHRQRGLLVGRAVERSLAGLHRHETSLWAFETTRNASETPPGWKHHNSQRNPLHPVCTCSRHISFTVMPLGSCGAVVSNRRDACLHTSQMRDHGHLRTIATALRSSERASDHPFGPACSAPRRQ